MPSEEIKNTICKIKSLPSPPKTYAKIKHLIQAGVSGLEKVAGVIEENPALAMKVLQVTNSAFFSRGAETTDIHSSVVRLGVDMVNDFVLFSETYEVASENPFLNLDTEINNCFAISKLSGLIAAHLDQELSEKAKLVGLLSSIGRSVLLQAYPEKSKEYSKILDCVNGLEVITLERNLFGADHAQVGAYLLLFWGFPSDVIDGLLYYLNIDKMKSEKYLLSVIVYLAQSLFVNNNIEPEIIDRYSLEARLPEWKVEANLLRNLK
jgi:HD-like signal output (HDOD) protein